MKTRGRLYWEAIEQKTAVEDTNKLTATPLEARGRGLVKLHGGE